jgi:hypothetical protein
VFEVEILSKNVNVAVGASASQSVTHLEAHASKAVDGDFSTFSHTTNDVEGDGSEWLEIDLGGLHSIDAVVVHNRWCQNIQDEKKCLCRLSKAVLSLTDEEGSSVASSSFQDTCGEATLVVNYEPNCPSPTELPTKLPTLPPISPRKWYPDQTEGVHDCIFSNQYPDWMSGGVNAAKYLFESEEDCCHQHQCDSYYAQMWYPEVIEQHIKCLFGTNYPVYYKHNPEGYLFETEDDCCEEYGCYYKTSAPTKNPTTTPTTAEPTSASPSENPTPSPSASPITFAPSSGAPTSAATARSPDNCYPNARFVKLESTTGKPIQVFEVEVLSNSVNVAVDKTATHSDTHKTFDASYAIDGDEGTFSHTGMADGPNGTDWLEIDLGGLYSIDTIVIHNRWCANKDDPNGCLCRLSEAMLALADEEGKFIASAQMPNTCTHDRVTVTFLPHCPSPTKAPVTSSPSVPPSMSPTSLSPTSRPTLPPVTSPPTISPTSLSPTSRPTLPPVTSPPTIYDVNQSETTPKYWYPNIDTPANDCVFGSDYKSWMALPHWHSYYLFGSKNACCCKHTCADMQCTQQAPPFNPNISVTTSTTTTTTTSTATTTTTTRESWYYPDVNEGHDDYLNCVYGSGYDDFMLMYDNFLFKTEEDCCRNRGPCKDWYWYPNLASQQKQCHFGKDYPAWMANYDNLLSSTEEECCAGECADDETS